MSQFEDDTQEKGDEMTTAKEYSILKQQYDRLFEANKKLLQENEKLKVKLINLRKGNQGG